MLCDDLEGWDGSGEGGGRSKREGTYRDLELSHCTAETNTTLQSNCGVGGGQSL